MQKSLRQLFFPNSFYCKQKKIYRVETGKGKCLKEKYVLTLQIFKQVLIREMSYTFSARASMKIKF